MKNPFKKQLGLLLLSAICAVPFTGSAQTVLFQENFDSGSLAGWSIFSGAGNGPTNDFTAEIIDYGTNQYVYLGATLPLPPCPDSSGTTKALKLTVNKNDASGAAAGVSLYPTGMIFSNNYALKFSMWVNFFELAAGSSELASMGINHRGTRVNFTAATAVYPGDGVWFGVIGDGDFGASGDYRSYLADPSTNGPNRLQPVTADSGFLDRNGDGFYESDATDVPTDPFAAIFPVPPGEHWGAVGKQWVQGEVRQQNGVITWLFNGYVIMERTNNSAWTNGNMMIGYIDATSSIPSPKEHNYVLFDNVQVIDLGTNPAPSGVSIAVIDADASEPGSDTASVTITRTGNINSALTVNLRIGGTALNGIDYVALPASVTFPPGSESTNLTVQVIDDGRGEPTETVVIDLAGSTNGAYFLRTGLSAAVNIADDGDLPVVTVATRRAIAYEMLRLGKLTVDLSNPTLLGDLNIPLTITGTATNGVDYVTISASATIPAGETNATFVITPIDNNLMDGTRTVTITVNPGSGYNLGSVTNGTVSIKDDDLPPGSGILFSNNFDTDTTLNWIVNANRIGEDTADFFYDYSADGISPAPRSTNGTTRGLKLKTNFTLPPSNTSPPSGISVSPRNQNFTNDYRLRFDMWINYNGPLADGGAGSTEYVSAGVGTTGNHPNWDSDSNIVDGIWFAVDGDGFGSAYQAFSGPTMFTASSGVYAAGSQGRSSPHYAEFGGDPAPLAGTYPELQGGITAPGNAGFAWHDVVVTKQGNTVTWTMDGLPIATVSATNPLANNVFVGYFNSFAGSSPEPGLSFGLVNNLRVEQLAVTTPPTLVLTRNGTNVTLSWSGSFILQSSTNVVTGYTDVAGATNPYPVNTAAAAQTFYRLKN